ncbi:type VI secretion system baseplate subunit TssG [Paraburkholderia sp. SOS3]|jgi:type VI secretion system protein ImpH|uniref:type VI secretion system baseplate subunit TssG n=1 Tax=Paraburkholderia sp. SOS3 TaxID=1926494 RepID=UPI000947591A|nr:type VI secretion system baseplate subunit TssG [Paraburkholderia sp. SOS3]APR39604.1 type VI secretion protein [Paraburkholderia sp. SOS3]
MKPVDSPALEPLVMLLLARAPHMSFMQLCRLFEMRAPASPGFGTRDTAAHEPVRFGSWPRLGFPAGELAAVEFDESEQSRESRRGGASGAESGNPYGDRDPYRVPPAPPTVRTTFMGLYGVDAAMPPHMIDEIALREEGHEALEAFLDQFNHRFVTLLYRAWKKYRYPESFRAGGVDRHSRDLLCLAGFGWGDKPERAGLPASRMLALLGLLIQRTRTPEGLEGVIALAAPGVRVRVDEFWPVAIMAGAPDPLSSARQGGAAAPDGGRRGLGCGYVLGKRMIYRNGAVRATLRPADARQAHDLLPGAWLHRELCAYVRLYVGVKANVHLRMTIPSTLAPQPTIGTRGASDAPGVTPAPRLGWTTVLPASDERLIHINLGLCEALLASRPNICLDSNHA